MKHRWDSREQKKDLTERLAEYGAQDPRWLVLNKRLLALGGLAVVPWGLRDPTHHMDRILSHRARTFSGIDALRENGDANSCHDNASALRDAGVVKRIATGWALSVDGLWRRHSWGVAFRENCPVETTEPRELYYGYILTAAEANAFTSEVWATDA